MKKSKNEAKFIFSKESDTLLVSAIEERLNLTYEQRIESHENARQLVSDLHDAGEKLRARSNKAS